MDISGRTPSVRCAQPRLGLDLIRLKTEGSVEHHLEGRAFGQHQVGSAGEQYGSQSSRGSGGGPNARSHTGMTRGASSNGADTRSGGCGFGYRAGIARLVSFAANFAFLTVELASVGVCASQ